MRWSWTKKEAPSPAGVPDAAPIYEPIFPARPAAAPLPAVEGPAMAEPVPAALTADGLARDGDAVLEADPDAAMWLEGAPGGDAVPAAAAGDAAAGWASAGGETAGPDASGIAARLVEPDVLALDAMAAELAPDGPVPGAGLAASRPPGTGLVVDDQAELPDAGAEAGALLEALYPLLLRRALDAHGRRHYGAVLHEHGIARGLVPVLRSLLESEEHRGVAAQNAVDALLRRDVTPGFGPVQHVISLGTSCYAAWLMQQCGVKRWSGPFDWLFGGVDMVVHCLEDDFASFLDAGQLQALGDGRSTHRRYGPGITAGPVFNHRDVTLPEHRGYTERCVARFRAALASPESKCFVMVVAGDPARPDSRLVGDFARLLAALSARTQGFRLLMVSHDQAEGGLASSLREVESALEGSLFRFRSASAMQAGLSFRQEWDNLVLKRLLWSNRYDLRDAPGV